MELSRILGGGGGGGAPVGSLLDFPNSLPDLYTKGSQTFLKTGVTTVATPYTDLPPALVESLLPVLEDPVAPKRRYSSDNKSTNSSHTVQDGTRIVSFLDGTATRDQYLLSEDTGANWIMRNLPEDGVVVGAEFMSGNLVLVYSNGRTYTSFDCKNWTFAGTFNYYAGTVSWIKKVNGRLYFLPANFWTNTGRNPVNDVTNSQSSFLWYTNDGTNFVKTATLTDTRRWNDIVYNGTNYVLSHCEISILMTLKLSANGTSGWSNSGNVSASTVGNPVANTGDYSTRPGPVSFMAVEGTNVILFCTALQKNDGTNGYYHAFASRSSDSGATWTTRSSWTNQGGSTIYGALNQPCYAEKVNGVWYCFMSSAGTYKLNGDINTTGTFDTQVTSTANTQYPAVSRKGYRPLFSASKWWWAGAFQGAPASRAIGGSAFILNTTDADPGPQNANLIKAFNFSNSKNLFFRGGATNQTMLCFSGPTYRKPASGTAPLNSSVGYTDTYDFSTDGGVTWQVKKMPVMGWWTSGCWDGTYFYVTCNDSQTETLAQLAGGSSSANTGATFMFRSTDGETWTLVNTLTFYTSNGVYAGAQFMTVMPAGSNAPGRLIIVGYAGSKRTVHYSDDRGVNFTQCNISSGDQKGSVVAAHFLVDLNVTNDGIYTTGSYGYSSSAAQRITYSKDGINFLNINAAAYLSWSSGYINSAFGVPGTGEILFCGKEVDGVWSSKDAGVSATKKSSFPGSSENRMTLRVDPVTNWVYALGGNKLYISKDFCSTWTGIFNLSLTFDALNAVVFDVYDGAVFVGDGVTLYRAPKGSYVNNFINMSAVAGSTKYLRIA